MALDEQEWKCFWQLLSTIPHSLLTSSRVQGQAIFRSLTGSAAARQCVHGLTDCGTPANERCIALLKRYTRPLPSRKLSRQRVDNGLVQRLRGWKRRKAGAKRHEFTTIQLHGNSKPGACPVECQAPRSREFSSQVPKCGASMHKSTES